MKNFQTLICLLPEITIINKFFSIFSTIVLPVMKLQSSLVVTGPTGAIYGLNKKEGDILSQLSYKLNLTMK